MATEINHLFGSCACERNQYTVIIPSASTTRAQVFFDNSASSRRAQASPVVAWLRVPLDWYSSTTIAHFPDESHSSIKRTFHTPTSNPTLPPTRRQFCGYCGSHLTQWNEEASRQELDVTLGSLLSESLEKLEALRILPDLNEEEGLVRGGSVHDEDHIATNERSTGEVVKPPPHLMSNRGMPYFEELVENSRLGKIKRQVGGHTSRDGSRSVQWEIVEIGGEGGSPEPMGGVVTPSTSGAGSKRPRLDL